MKSKFLLALNSYFKIKARGSEIPIEIIAGITTFMTMSYIIFLQPEILAGMMPGYQPTGMDVKALMVTTCIASAFASILMGVLANYPIALAPGMGENFFFVSVVAACASSKIGLSGDAAWQTALAVVFVSGIIFLIITALKLRKMIMGIISPNLQYAIAGGIGMFIALLGLRNSGLIVTTNAGLFLTNDFHNKSLLIFTVGLFSMVALQSLKVKGGILWGILIGAVLAVVLGKVELPSSLISTPPSISPIFMKMDFSNLYLHLHSLIPFILIFTVMDIFDTLGTLVGVGTQAGLMENNKLPNCEKAFAADACGTVFGALCGHSTVTSYIESAAGVENGGRTGLSAVIAGLCFVVAIFFSPLIGMIAHYPAPFNPITAPALVIVGAMMLKNVSKINWDDYTESIPAFLVLIGIPACTNIGDGLALGLISYPAIKLLTGKHKEIHWLAYLIGAILFAYLVFIRTA
jgi:AGZA family xanthine/uracil permease-like MFS transporter